MRSVFVLVVVIAAGLGAASEYFWLSRSRNPASEASTNSVSESPGWEKWQPSAPPPDDDDMTLFGIGNEVDPSNNRELTNIWIEIRSREGVWTLPVTNLRRVKIPGTAWECRLRNEPRPNGVSGAGFWMAAECRAGDAEAQLMTFCQKYADELRANRDVRVVLTGVSGAKADLELKCASGRK